MRFMMLMIPKGYESAAPGTMPDAKAVEAMMKYNEALQKAGVLLALDGLHPPSMGARVSFEGGKPKVTDGPFAEAKEVLGGYWMIQVKLEGRSDRVGQALSRRAQRGHRDPPGPGNGRLPCRLQKAAEGFEEMQRTSATQGNDMSTPSTPTCSSTATAPRRCASTRRRSAASSR